MNAIRSQRPTEMGAPAGWSECHQKMRRLVDAHGDGLLVHTLAVLDRPSLPGFRALHRAWHERSVFEHHRRQVLQHPERFSAQIKSRANKDIADIEYQQLANVVST
ncbi:MAG: hypothetical protein NTZ50_15245 [Chloroflexi bacterium]|nr:hypothetical protein [Chloroflexota bacterium]